MNGIIFFCTKQLDTLRDFYINEVGSSLWLEQADCLVFKHGNLLFGFCQRDTVDLCGIICFFYETRIEVDKKYEQFKNIADSPPIDNPKYDIYHFFATDPDGRKIEFQAFNREIDI